LSCFAGCLLRPRFFGRLAKQLLAGVDPIFDAGRSDLGFGQRPEPQCTPSIHDSPQTLIRPIWVLQFRFDLRPRHRRPWSRLLKTPHADGPSGLGLGYRQTLERNLPEHIGLLRQPDDSTDLPSLLRIAELRPRGLAPPLESGNGFWGKLLAFFGIGSGSPAFSW